MRVRLLLALALATLVPAGVIAQPAAPAAPVDWTRQVERTAEGGWRMGSPEAPVKLVEYASITCSHCADFAAAAGPALRTRVASGQVSWEVRPFLIFPTDPGMFMLLQCTRPGAFFDVADALYAEQEQWASRVQAQEARLRALPRNQQLAAITRATGTEPTFRAAGLDTAAVNACLADDVGLQRLVTAHERASAAGVQGTPSFFVNGRQVEAGTWAQLEPLLASSARAGGAGEQGR